MFRRRSRGDCPFLGECEHEVSMRHYEKYCVGAFKKCPYFKIRAEDAKRPPQRWRSLSGGGGGSGER